MIEMQVVYQLINIPRQHYSPLNKEHAVVVIIQVQKFLLRMLVFFQGLYSEFRTYWYAESVVLLSFLYK